MEHSSRSRTNALDANGATQESASDVEATWPAARWCEMALLLGQQKVPEPPVPCVPASREAVTFQGGPSCPPLSVFSAQN